MNTIKPQNNIESDEKKITRSKNLARSKKIIISSVVYTIIIMLVFSGLCLIFPNNVHDIDAGSILGIFLLNLFFVTMITYIFWDTKFKVKVCSVVIVLVISAILAYRKEGYFINVSAFAGIAIIIFCVLGMIERTRQYATYIIKFLTRKSK